VVSSAVETSVGLAAGLALAAALPDLPYACGLGTLSLLEGDVVGDPLVPVAGEIEVRRPVVDEEALRRWEAPAAGWRGRALDAQAELGGPAVIGVAP
ncbi:O-succinylbenzoate synthase, partial [Actinomadura darangshiensis]